jgi:hypothetical protein
MADNVAIKSDATTTIGTIRTDEDVTGSGHVQYMKLMHGTDGVFNIVSSESGLPVSGNVVLTSGDITRLGGVAISMGTGVRDSGTQRVTIATNDSVPVTIATVPSHAVTNAGTFAVQAAQTAATNNVTAAQAWAVRDFPQASGGLSTYSFISGTGVQAASIKASGGQVYNLQFFNVTSGVVYVSLYNQSTSPTTSNGPNILWRGIVPGATTGGGYAIDIAKGLAFPSGIGIRVTGGVGSGDSTGLTSDSIIGNIAYK